MTENTCKNCKHFVPPNKDDEYKPFHGLCHSGKLLDGPFDKSDPNSNPRSDTAVGGGYDGYGDYIEVGVDFGCIHFERKV